MATSEAFPAGDFGHVGNLLSDYLGGDLPEAQRTAVEEHLAACGRCARDLASLRFTVQLVRQLPSRPVPRSFAIPASESRPGFLTWLRWSTGALAALLVALIAAQLVLPTTPRPAAPTAVPPAAAPAASIMQASRAAPAAAAPAAGAAASNAAQSVAEGSGQLPRSSGAGPSNDRAMAAAAATTATAYPIPTGVPKSGPTAVPSYPAPNQPVATAPPAPTSSGTYPAGARPGSNAAASAPTATPQALDRTFTMTPALIIVTVLLVLSGAALVLLGRRR